MLCPNFKVPLSPDTAMLTATSSDESLLILGRRAGERLGFSFGDKEKTPLETGFIYFKLIIYYFIKTILRVELYFPVFMRKKYRPLDTALPLSSVPFHTT